MRVRELMSKTVHVTTPLADCVDAWHQMKQLGVHHLPVVGGGQVVGLLSEGDLRALGASGRSGRPVASVMSTPVVSASPTLPVAKAALLMRGEAVGALVVLEQGQPVGMLTTSDLLHWIHTHGEREETVPPLKPLQRSARWPRVGPRAP